MVCRMVRNKPPQGGRRHNPNKEPKLTMTPPEEINLAPKAIVDTDDDDTEIDNDEL